MSRHVRLLLLLLVVASTPVLADDNTCPCVPAAPLWTVSSCDSWNCAQAAMVAANGDPYVLSMPTMSSQHKWVVLRRVTSGGSAVSPDNPFLIDSFESVAQASALYAALSPEMVPIMLSTVDGKLLVVRLRTPERRRAAAR